MVKKSVLSRASLFFLKSTEAAHKVVPTVIRLVGDSLVTVGQLLEETDGQLEADEVGTAESGGHEGVAHPGLSHDSVAGLELTDQGKSFVNGDSSKSDAEGLFDLLDTHDLVNLLGVLVVVAIRSLNLLNSMVTNALAGVSHVSQVPVLLQLLLHLQ